MSPQEKSSGEPSNALDVTKSYKVIERVISQGYDLIGISLHGARYVLRTLSSAEETEVRVRSSLSGTAAHRYAWTMAYSTLSIAGVDCLRMRSEDVLQDLLQHYLLMPSAVFSKVYEAALDLTLRQDEASSLFGGYLYTSQSRFMWESFRSSGGRWGVLYPDAGTSLLREMWVRGNVLIDQEDASKAQWDVALFLASAQNPKGAKDSSTRLKSSRETQETERKELALYGSRENRDLILDVVRGEQEHWTSDLATREDILGELDRQMRGEKDKHDLFVEEYFRKQAELYAARKAAQDAAQEAARLKAREKRGERFQGSRQATEAELAALGLGSSVVTVHGKRVLGAKGPGR